MVLICIIWYLDCSCDSQEFRSCPGIAGNMHLIKVDQTSDAHEHNYFNRLEMGVSLIVDIYLYFKRKE